MSSTDASPAPGPAPAGGEKTWTVSKYNQAVRRYLKENVPPVWVHGVITQLNVRDRITYVTLGDFHEGEHKPRASLQVFLWTSELQTWNLRFASLPTPFELKVELKVLVCLEAEFYVPFGKFQPKVVGVDPCFTLGELAQTRRKIIEALMRDGLLEKNKALRLPPAPLRVGLITAPGSAAQRDFVSVLQKSGFAFDVRFHPAKMQGEATEATVLRALRRLSRTDEDLDLICLIRGGGGRTDLIYFDSEAICRAIAGCPVPVLTGIGHEIDQSLADLVAHADKITPTDCADFLVQRLKGQLDRLEEGRREIESSWKLVLEEQYDRLAGAGRTIGFRWRLQERSQREHLTRSFRELRAGSRRGAREHRERMKRLLVGMRRGPSKWIAFEESRMRIHLKLLHSAWLRGRREGRSGLQWKEKTIRALHPARQLERGFGILRDSKGRVVRYIEQVEVGADIRAEVADGYVTGRVTGKDSRR